MPVCTIPIMILTFPIRINCVSRFFRNFADETSRAVAFSGLANRAFFTCHGGQGTMWKTMLNFKNNVEWKRIFYPSSLRSLLKHPSLHLLNHSMHRLKNRGFNSARAAHDHALIDELVRRGVDVSAISNGHSISFAHHIALDESAVKLVIPD